MGTPVKIYACSCNGTQKVDGKALAELLGLDAPLKVHDELCRSQLEAFEAGARADEPMIVCCTQEAPIFLETWDAAGGTVEPTFVNIRERAGWSDEGPKAKAKMAALIAEARADVPPTTTVAMASEGRALVLGSGQAALDAAKHLAQTMDVTVCLDDPGDAMPPQTADVAVLRGKVTHATGHLGAFNLTVEGLAMLTPSSRDDLEFGPPAHGPERLDADVIVDVRGAAALFPAPDKRDGYLRPDPGDPARVARALADAQNLVGEFEKPRYVRHDAAKCAHARNGIEACTKCLDACPTGAITPDGDHVAIDPYVCAGCGTCASVCPTGANTYLYPALKGLAARARAMLGTYRGAKAPAPVVLLADAAYGDEAVAMMARFGRGLPARVLPLFVNNVGALGLDALMAVAAYGAGRIAVLVDPAKAEDMAPVLPQIEYANAIFDGLGFGADRITVLDDADPIAVQDQLWALPDATTALGRADFLVEGDKRETLSMALAHLHGAAPTRPERIALPDGAPFGAVVLDEDACTLCLACTSTCPTAALKSNPDRPELGFRETACVQCGLCRRTCPEDAITLAPGIDFTPAARDLRVLKYEEPFDCIRCGAPFGTKASIERMIDKLADHPMFGEPGQLERLKMCEVCRVADMTEQGADPFATGTAPTTRTTDDYIREREAKNRSEN